jgi:hypothetical protein
VGAFLRCIALVVLGALLAHAGRPRANDASKTPNRSAHQGRDAEDIAVFVYDAVAGINAGLAGSINAIDAALTAILAGALTAVLFTADKLVDLPRTPGVCALVLFGCSAMICALGYFVGLLSGMRDPDVMRPRKFIADVVEQPGSAIVGAIYAQMETWEANMTIRLCKRIAALVAVVMLIAGVISIAVARWAVIVV